jgi:Nucleotide modification associated domain 2
MSKIYIYVVDRDLGFAPNPFHGYCTLATCKPRIRNTARVDDWVIGMGGRKLKATGRCVFAMRVSEVVTFNEYWSNPAYFDKKPVINGSRKMMVGDNIYHKTSGDIWQQALSHHSNKDGGIDLSNLNRDTSSEKVLISQYFCYFGGNAPVIPTELLNSVGYKNQIGHRTFDNKNAAVIVEWLHNSFRESFNQVLADPFNFDKSEKRYSASDNKIS